MVGHEKADHSVICNTTDFLLRYVETLLVKNKKDVRWGTSCNDINWCCEIKLL